MKVYLVGIFLLSTGICSAYEPLSMDRATQIGKSFGKSQHEKQKDNLNFSVDGLEPKEDFNFDPNHAYERATTGQIPSNEIGEFLLSNEMERNIQENGHVDQQEYFFQRAELASSHPESIKSIEEDGVEFFIHSCEESGDPYPLVLIRRKEVKVKHEPAEKKVCHVCEGHESLDKVKNGKEADRKKDKHNRNFNNDKSIKHFSVVTYKTGDGYEVKSVWVHHDNVSNCNHQKEKEIIVKPDSWEEESESWIHDDDKAKELAMSENCTLIDKQCLDAKELRLINGKEVLRKCWVEKMAFLCKPTYINKCASLKAKNCRLLSKECVKPHEKGCSLWKKLFKCSEIIERRSIDNSLDSLHGSNQERPESISNDSFAEVATKLSILESIQKEIEQANVHDARSISLFSGSKSTCTKNVSQDLMYDCCFSQSGLAVNAKLTTCTPEEINLASLRENGQTHYVGKYGEDFIGLWKSRDVHVFCVFPSKLSRVLQEQARNQLGLGWGDPKHPICSGLSPEQISSLDFNKLDLSEVFEDQFKDLPDIDQKMRSFQDRIQSIHSRLENEKVRGRNDT